MWAAIVSIAGGLWESMRGGSAQDRQSRIERALLDCLGEADYEPMPQSQLLHRMHVPGDRRPGVRRVLRHLVESGRVIEGKGGRLRLPEGEGTVTGLLHRHRDGYGFVAPEDDGSDVFIPPPYLGSNLSGDRVVVRVTRQGRGDRREGVIVRTVTNRSRELLGVFQKLEKGGRVQPFDPAMAQPIDIREADRGGARDRQVVRAEILRVPDGSGAPEGKVLEILGDLDEPGMDVLVVARKYGLAGEFPAEVLAAAEALPTRIGPKTAHGRTRFDDPPVVTIDGETAKDFDDAIAVEETDSGFRLWVHIADVAHFVEDGATLDEEARRRGTSVYFPDRVLPMFPEQLSNDLCSLRPQVDRLVQTAILDFDGEGEPQRARFDDGIIHSAARLTYTQVAAVIDGAPRVPGVPQRVVPMLLAADRLRRKLELRRRRRGSVDFDLPEPRILLDVEGEMTGITIEPRNKAHRLIEEFMLAANEAVAGYLEDHSGPCMYRIHDSPDPVKLETLAAFVASFGVEFPTAAETIEPADFQRLLDAFDGRPEAQLVAGVALRSMKQARYAMENSGHFGLASPVYCHFTSPIRRYPDLVVHRLLRARRAGRVPLEENVARLTPVAESCSELERNAEAAERELLNWKKVAFIEEHVGESFHGVVTGVASFGMFVQLEANLVEGLLRIERLGDERFEHDERRMELRGERSGTRFRLGDRVDVRVERVDRVLQRVDFGLTASPAAEARTERQRAGVAPARRKRGEGAPRSGPKRRGRGGRRERR